MRINLSFALKYKTIEMVLFLIFCHPFTLINQGVILKRTIIFKYEIIRITPQFIVVLRDSKRYFLTISMVFISINDNVFDICET